MGPVGRQVQCTPAETHRVPPFDVQTAVLLPHFGGDGFQRFYGIGGVGKAARGVERTLLVTGDGVASDGLERRAGGGEEVVEEQRSVTRIFGLPFPLGEDGGGLCPYLLLLFYRGQVAAGSQPVPLLLASTSQR